MKSTILRIPAVLVGFFIACILGIFGGFVYEGGNPIKLIIPGSFFIVVLPPLGVCLMAFGGEAFVNTWIKALGMMFTPKATPLTPSECGIIQTAKTVAYLGAAIATILGFVITMGSLSAGKEAIGEHIAACLCSLVYAMVFDGIIIQTILRRNDWLSGADNKGEKLEPNTWITGALFGLCILFLFFGITFLTLWLLEPEVRDNELKITEKALPAPKKVCDFILSELETLVANTKGKQHLLFSLYVDAPHAAKEKLEEHRAQLIHEVNLLGAQTQPEDLKDPAKLRVTLAQGVKVAADKILGSDDVKNVYLLDLIPVLEQEVGKRSDSLEKTKENNSNDQLILSEIITPINGTAPWRYLLTSVYFEASPEDTTQLEENRAQLIDQVEELLGKVKEQDLNDPFKLELLLTSEFKDAANKMLVHDAVKNVYLLDCNTVLRARMDAVERDRERMFNELKGMLPKN